MNNNEVIEYYISNSKLKRDTWYTYIYCQDFRRVQSLERQLTSALENTCVYENEVSGQQTQMFFSCLVLGKYHECPASCTPVSRGSN